MCVPVSACPFSLQMAVLLVPTPSTGWRHNQTTTSSSSSLDPSSLPLAGSLQLCRTVSIPDTVCPVSVTRSALLLYLLFGKAEMKTVEGITGNVPPTR
ncbi:hypothetical protein GGR57DRAFT_466948 [Xylariaceae sp. FL1272]|nr:hypothetical protein GGR57DRAFT_466948 [Xylariaceae sp. FL1272]